VKDIDHVKGYAIIDKYITLIKNREV